MRLLPAYLGIALCVCAFVVVAATLMGRAIDAEVQDRVLIVRDGVTLDCVRQVDEAGSVSYGDCSRVP